MSILVGAIILCSILTIFTGYKIIKAFMSKTFQSMIIEGVLFAFTVLAWFIVFALVEQK